jgi:DHA2 family multidrug resistance protein
MSSRSPISRDASRLAAGKHNPWVVTLILSMATFMTVLDTSIANVTLLNIAGALGTSVDESTWGHRQVND